MRTVLVPTFDEFNKYSFTGYVKVKIKNKPNWKDHNKITRPLPGIPQGGYSDKFWIRFFKDRSIQVSDLYDGRQRVNRLKGYYITLL